MTAHGRARGLRALAVALALVTAACGGGDGDGGATDTAGTLRLERETTTTLAAGDAALAAVLPEEPPLPGFVPADDVLGTGPLDLEGAAAAETDAEAEQALLEEHGFERGASRAWIGDGDDVVYVAVYDFATADGASSYLREAAQRLDDAGATGFDVAEVDGAVGLTTVEESGDGGFTVHAVTFTRGDRWVLALVGSPGGGRSPEEAARVAATQASRLS